MTVEIIFFFLLALGVLVTSLLVVSFRNPINSAISLIFSFLCMAGIYALLHAPFMAVIQVMVYAGAIMVLFLFVIMLLNLSDEDLGGARITLTKVIAALVAVGLFGALFKAIDTIRVVDDVQVTEADKGKTIGEVLAASGEQFTDEEVERHVLVDGRAVRDAKAPLEGGEVIAVGKTRYHEQGLGRLVASPSTEDARFAAGVKDEAAEAGGAAAPEGEQVARQRAEVKRRLRLWSDFGSIEAVGQRMYTKWLFPFEVTALLLLAAIVGAVIMAKRRL